MSRVIAELLTTLSMFVPMRYLLGAGVVIVVLALPYWLENVRERQVRGLVRRLVRAEPEQRIALEGEILRLAGDRPARLRALVDAANRYDQRALRDRGIELLEQAGANDDARRLREVVAPKKRRWVDAVEAALHVERVAGEGRITVADELLAEALEAFPQDEDLLALKGRLAQPHRPEAQPEG